MGGVRMVCSACVKFTLLAWKENWGEEKLQTDHCHAPIISEPSWWFEQVEDKKFYSQYPFAQDT